MCQKVNGSLRQKLATMEFQYNNSSCIERFQIARVATQSSGSISYFYKKNYYNVELL